MKLSQALEGYRIDRLANGYSPTTIAAYNYAYNKLVLFLGNPELEDITTDKLLQFFYELRTNTELSPAYIKKVWTAIRSFYNWVISEFDITRPDTLPMPHSESKVVVPFSEDEIKALLRACEMTAPAHTERRRGFVMSRPTALRDKAIVLLLLDTGLRVSELARLEIQDINLETGEIQVQPYLSGRKSKSRSVYFGKSSRRVLWRYLAEREQGKLTDRLFVSDNRQNVSMNRDSIYNVVEGLGKRAGVRNVHPHRFRHTFAVQYLRNGGDVFTLQRLLGHNSLEMVKAYLSLARADDASAHRRASPVDNWKL